jgi:ABC-type nitrate/sulfonate/bicarbonate transport system substrate-binding protein
MKVAFKIVHLVCAAMLQLLIWGFSSAQQLHMSYPGLTGESSPLWIAKEAGLFRDYGIDARLIYMEGGRLSIQSLLSNSSQFMTGDAVSALSAIAGGADIVLLVEAVVMAATGGVIGILLGIGSSEVLKDWAQWPTLIDPMIVVIAFVFSGAVGVFFGFYPAKKAANLDPIDALRYE